MPYLEGFDKARVSCCVNGVVSFKISHPEFKHLSVVFGSDEDGPVDFGVCAFYQDNPKSYFSRGDLIQNLGDNWQLKVQFWLLDLINKRGSLPSEEIFRFKKDST